MRHRLTWFHLAAALLFGFGLAGAGLVSPSAAGAAPVAVDGTPTTSGVTPTTGSLVLLKYFCDGGTGVVYQAGGPGEIPPSLPTAIGDFCVPLTVANAASFKIGLKDAPDPISYTTTGSGAITVPALEAGTYTVTEIVPGVGGDTDGEKGDVTVEAGKLTYLNVLNLTDTGGLQLYKYHCDADPDNLVPVAYNVFTQDSNVQPDFTAYDACSPEQANFTITQFDDTTTLPVIPVVTVVTVNGVASIDDIPTTGPYVHSIAEDGTDTSKTFSIQKGKTTTIIVVNSSVPTGTLDLTKQFCTGPTDTTFEVTEPVQPAGAAPGDATFDVFPYGDLTAEPVVVQTGVGGHTTVSLPTTSGKSPYLIRERSSQKSVEFGIVKGDTTTILVKNFTPAAPETGTLDVDKYLCSGLTEPTIDVAAAGAAAPIEPGNCGDAASASFRIYPFSDLNATPVTLDVQGSGSVDLPVTAATPHLLQEIDSDGNAIASANFSIAGGLTTAVVQNPTFGAILVSAYICDGDAQETLVASGPGVAAAVIDPSTCSPLNRAFTLTPFGGTGGSGTSTIDLSTGDDGMVTVPNIPTTFDVSHALTETASGLSVDVHVDSGVTTEIQFVSYVPVDGTGAGAGFGGSGSGSGSGSGDSGSATTLPSTGIGPAQRANGLQTLLLALTGAAGLAGYALATRKRAA